MTSFDRASYTGETFARLTPEPKRVESVSFQNCQFKQCRFSGLTFSKASFTDCDFESCDFSLAKFPGCKFSEVAFRDCKLVGINWTELYWPLVKLASPLYFYECNLSHSSFFGLTLADLIIEACKAHEVDFRDANLNHASFTGTDLLQSLFMHTNLKHADFTNAMNYNIDPETNEIGKASFSFPDVIALLNHLDINISGWPGGDDL